MNAEERRRDGAPDVACTNTELLAALQGTPIKVSALDGTAVWLRLMTVDEAIQANHAARERLTATMLAAGHVDWEPPPPITATQAVQLTRPLR